MNADQAWQSVLGQLQMEMPRASFDTWVRDTKVISLQDNVLTVSVVNAYARDWLESRLTSTVNRLLVGILNASVDVNFVVADPTDEPADADSEDVQQPATMLEISPVETDSLYEKIVRPNRAVYLPGYFRNWLKYLGPDLSWCYVAFRQAAYANNGKITGNTVGRFTAMDLAKLSGITERGFWKRVGNGETWRKLKGLVEISDHGPQWDESSDTPKRLPRRYTVAMTLPLTPVDAHSLRTWFTLNLERYGGAEAILRAAVEVPVDELIPADATELDEPITVTQLAKDLFGGGEVSDDLLEHLASDIQNRLMPQNDLIVITVYFMEHVLGILGAGRAWLLTLLRDRCYPDPETNRIRNRVTVKGGYEEIAGWLGMSRSKTAWEWFNEKDGEGKYKNPAIHLYLCEVELEQPASRSARTFDVLIDEVPGEIREAALLDKLQDLHDRIMHASTGEDGAEFMIGMARSSGSHGAKFSIGMARSSGSLGAEFMIAMARSSVSDGAKFIVKNLRSLKPTSKTMNTTTCTTSGDPDTDPVEEQAVVVDLPSAWVLDRILIVNKVHPKTQKAVRGASSQALISWLLYALSPQGRGIDKPVNYALARLTADLQSGAGEGYDDLANLPPAALIGIAEKVSRGALAHALFRRDETDDLTELWIDVMGTDSEPALKLMRLLPGNKAAQ